MGGKTTKRKRPAGLRMQDDSITDTELEGFLAAQHYEIEAKLDKARASIARGKAVRLESLPALLRAAQHLPR